jgi:capsid portal protein
MEIRVDDECGHQPRASSERSEPVMLDAAEGVAAPLAYADTCAALGGPPPRRRLRRQVSGSLLPALTLQEGRTSLHGVDFIGLYTVPRVGFGSRTAAAVAVLTGCGPQ